MPVSFERPELAKKHDVLLSLHEEDPDLNGVLGLNEQVAESIFTFVERQS